MGSVTTQRSEISRHSVGLLSFYEQRPWYLHLGTLPSSTNLWFVYPLGFALVIPSWWLVASVGGLTRDEKSARHKAIGLNAWLGLVLLVPAGRLAAPAAVNVLLLFSRIQMWCRPEAGTLVKFNQALF